MCPRKLMGVVILLALFTVPMRAIASGTIRLTVPEAVSLALKQSPRIKAANFELDAAEAARKKARARFGPVFQVEARAMYFNEPPSLGGGGMSAEDVGGLQQLAGADPFDNAMIQFFQELPSMFQSEQYDINITARVVQPLTPLYAVYHGYRLAELGLDVAGIVKQRQKDQLTYQVKAACLGVLQAQAGVRALEEAIKTVESHVAMAGSYLEVGLIGRQDFLQAKVRLAEVRGQLLKIQHGVLLAKAAVAMLLNLPDHAEVEIVAPEFKVGKEKRLKLEPAQAMALLYRPEIKELGLRIRQAEHGVKATRVGYIPQISAMGMYQYNEGSTMTPPAWTVGALLTWPLWEWGATYYSVEEAQAKFSKAKTGLEELRAFIKLDVQKAWLGTKEALERIDIARSALTHAKEQLRIEQDRYQQHVNTSTDVLDAQSRLTRTKVESESARYDYLIAVAALEKAIGTPDKEETK